MAGRREEAPAGARVSQTPAGARCYYVTMKLTTCERSVASLSRVKAWNRK